MLFVEPPPVVDSSSEQDPLMSFVSEDRSGDAGAADAGIRTIAVAAPPRHREAHIALQTRLLARATGVTAVMRSQWARFQKRQFVRSLRTVRTRRDVARLSVRYSRFAVGVAVGALIASADSRPPTSTRERSSAVIESAVSNPPVVRRATGGAAVDAVGTTLIAPAAPSAQVPVAVVGPGPAVKPAAIRAPAARAAATPARHRGTLIVTSQPVGASVFVNNRLAGVTPLVMNALPVGSRAVRLSLDGYAPWSRAVSVVTNRSTTVSAKLEPSR
jgi:hypothetical protein